MVRSCGCCLAEWDRYLYKSDVAVSVCLFHWSCSAQLKTCPLLRWALSKRDDSRGVWEGKFYTCLLKCISDKVTQTAYRRDGYFGSGFQGCQGAMAGSVWWMEHLTPWSPGNRAGSSHIMTDWRPRKEGIGRGQSKTASKDMLLVTYILQWGSISYFSSPTDKTMLDCESSRDYSIY